MGEKQNGGEKSWRSFLLGSRDFFVKNLDFFSLEKFWFDMGGLRIQNLTPVCPAQMGQMERAIVYLRKGRSMEDIQNCDSYINIPSSRTYR
jgi:hypothetical protein